MYENVIKCVIYGQWNKWCKRKTSQLFSNYIFAMCLIFIVKCQTQCSPQHNLITFNHCVLILSNKISHDSEELLDVKSRISCSSVKNSMFRDDQTQILK